MEATTPKRTTIDRHQVFEFVSKNPECREDTRVKVLNELADACAKYDHQIRWLVDKLNREIEAFQTYGVRRVDPCLMQTSLIHDVTEAAVQIRTLRGILEWTTKAKTNPDATALDIFINDHLNPGA